MKDTLKVLVEQANSGDKKALEAVIIEIKDYIYNLSLKMLLYPEDAKDATQEILIQILVRSVIIIKCLTLNFLSIIFN